MAVFGYKGARNAPGTGTRLITEIVRQIERQCSLEGFRARETFGDTLSNGSHEGPTFDRPRISYLGDLILQLQPEG